MTQANWRDPLHEANEHLPSDNFTRKRSRGKRFHFPPLKSIILSLVVIFFVLGIIGLLAAAWISRDLPSTDGVLKRNVTVSTKIYDRTGQTVLYDIHGNIKRSLITLDDVPDLTKKAVLTAEDRNFYTHSGVSFSGIFRSLITNVLTGSKIGGSTLTQQFVKNAILTNEKTYTRKFKELILTYQIEQKFSKDQIFNMYLNEIPYGSVIYGIEAASQSFFGKPAKDLTLAESAIIAAIPNRPTYYSPYGSNKDKLLVRQRYILDSMVELGHITKDQAEAAKNEKLSFKPMTESIIAPHFVMYIKELLSEKYGEDFINQEGLKVYTTLDLDKQKIAEEAIKSNVEVNGKKYGFGNASLVALDPKTGQILTMVGSADYFNDDIDGQVNVAISSRQPGSSFKPIVYTASFIKGYTPDTVIYDTITNFDNTGAKKYEPHNYHNDENGPVTLRKALAGSLNIPAVKLTYLTGMDNILDLADKLGYTTLADRSRLGLSLVLGGAEVKLLEHTAAYGALSQDGVKHDTSAILKIEDSKGKIIEEFKDKNDQVIDQEIARQTTDILSDDGARSYVFGSGSRLTLPGRPVAAKTGTTNDFHDAWTMGYTPSLVCGVWVGNANNDEMTSGADGSVVAAPIWQTFMKEALKDTPVESFVKPQPVVTGKSVLDGQVAGGREVKVDTMSGKLATQYTPSSTIKVVTTGEIHDILYYVYKDDPRGPLPDDPTSDPQYNNWEAGVKAWAVKQGLSPEGVVGAIPTEYDNIHLQEDQPKVGINSPSDKATVKTPTIDINISGSAKRGVKTTEYYIDNDFVSAVDGLSENKTIDLSDYESGWHTLTIRLKDDLQNTGTTSIDFNLVLSGNLPALNFTSPNDNAALAKFPVALKGDITNKDKIKQIDLYYKPIASTTEVLIGSVTSINDNFNFNWKKSPGPGDYELISYIFNFSDKKYSGDKLQVTVK